MVMFHTEPVKNMSIVAIEGMRFYAYHGFYPEERAIGGEYLVDAYIGVDSSKAATGDDLNETVDYETIYRVTKIVMQEPVKLIETLAQKLIDRLKTVLPTAKTIRARITKVNPPLGGSVQRAYVELEEDCMVKSVGGHRECLTPLNSKSLNERRYGSH